MAPQVLSKRRTPEGGRRRTALAWCGWGRAGRRVCRRARASDEAPWLARGTACDRGGARTGKRVQPVGWRRTATRSRPGIAFARQTDRWRCVPPAVRHAWPRQAAGVGRRPQHEQDIARNDKGLHDLPKRTGNASKR